MKLEPTEEDTLDRLEQILLLLVEEQPASRRAPVKDYVRDTRWESALEDVGRDLRMSLPTNTAASPQPHC